MGVADLVVANHQLFSRCQNVDFISRYVQSNYILIGNMI